MVIIQDSREKVEHKKYLFDFFNANNITVVRKVLEVGDYMLPNGKISIDLKGGGLQELANDLVSDFKGLNKKYKKCLDKSIHLIVLIEERVITSLKMVYGWKPKYGKVSGRYLMDKIFALQVSYGIEFVFCKREETGQKIIDILTQE